MESKDEIFAVAHEGETDMGLIPLWTTSTLGTIHVTTVFRHRARKRLDRLCDLWEKRGTWGVLGLLWLSAWSTLWAMAQGGKIKQSIVSCWDVKWKFYLDFTEEKSAGLEILAMENIRNAAKREKEWKHFKRASGQYQGV